MVNETNETIQKISKIYNNLSYYDIYSTSLLIFILLTVLLIIFHFYFVVMINSNEIKKNWNENRCKPQNILFAGFINKPINKTIFEFTNENFNYCIQNILSSISSYALQPFNYLFDIFVDVFNEINDAIQAIRNMISNIRSNITNIIMEIMNRLLNIITPIQTMMIALNDTFGKVQGILTASLMTSLTAYFALQSLMGAIIQFIIMILIAMAIVILSLWLGLFTWPAAVSMTAIFVAISIPLTIIVVFMTQMLHIHTNSVPKVPHGSKPKCFDENTIFKLKNGKVKKIKDLELYDELINNSKITAIIKLNSNDETMYNLNNIILSGSHPVLFIYNCIIVKNHPLSEKILNYNNPFLYAINTDIKIIEINNCILSDWDEVYNNYDNVVNFLKQNNIWDLKDIHLYIDKGFDEKINIQLWDKTFKQINEIKIGEKLINGEIVYGFVKLKNIECFSNNYKNTNKILYNLLTDKGTFIINNELIFDYNNCLNFE